MAATRKPSDLDKKFKTQLAKANAEIEKIGAPLDDTKRTDRDVRERIDRALDELKTLTKLLLKGANEPPPPPEKVNGQPVATIVLGSGAPNSPLMSGFLAAVYDEGKTFNNFFTAGGGGLIGLSLVAPKEGTPRENVEGILHCAVHDAIYKRLPVNYKVFKKNSKWLPRIEKLFDKYKKAAREMKIPKTESGRRLFEDLVDLGATMVAPGGLSRKEMSVCAPFAILGEVVDFKKLKGFTGQYFLNAHNVSTGRAETFDKSEINHERFTAALSFPFIYPPGKLGKHMYYEGADTDPVGLLQLMKKMTFHPEYFPSGHSIVMLDVLGSLEQAIVRPPRSLWDSYGVSMLTPIVSCARWSKAVFRERHVVNPPTAANSGMIKEMKRKLEDRKEQYYAEREMINIASEVAIEAEQDPDKKMQLAKSAQDDVGAAQRAMYEAVQELRKGMDDWIDDHEAGFELRRRKGTGDETSWRYDIVLDKDAKHPEPHDFHEIHFDVPKEQWPTLIDWSYSNLRACFDLGYQTGKEWLSKHRDLLPDREKGSVNVLGTSWMAGTVTEIPKLGPQSAQDLARADIFHPEQLRERCGTKSGRERVLAQMKENSEPGERLPREGQLKKWAQMADLMRMGIDPQYATALEKAGVEGSKALAEQNAQELVHEMQKHTTMDIPAAWVVDNWIDAAKKLANGGQERTEQAELTKDDAPKSLVHGMFDAAKSSISMFRP